MAKPRVRAPLYGSETPRVFTPPLRELTPETTHGFECISFAEDVLGLTLYPWQKWLLIHALELNEDGTYRFRTVVLLVARQNGKSTVMQVLALWRMYLDGAKLVLGTAQNLDIAEEQWAGAVDLAEGVPELKEQIDKVNKTNGKKALELDSGERYKVQAANRRGGRGLSSELVILDELREHATWDAWAAVSKTTMARKFAQVWAASNAGDALSIVLRFLRNLAHSALGNPDEIEGLEDLVKSGTPPEPVEDDDEDLFDEEEEADSLGIFEWSATPGCSIWDRAAWQQANPSLGYTITTKSIAAAARSDPEGTFRTEVLCQWLDTTADGPFPEDTWERSIDPNSVVDGKFMYCVDMSWDRMTAYISVAGRRPDGAMHVEVVAMVPPQFVKDYFDSEWTTSSGEVMPRRASDPMSLGVTLQAKGAPVSSLLDDLHAVKDLKVIEWEGVDLGRWTGKFFDAICGVTSPEAPENGTPAPEWTLGDPLVFHLPQPALDTAARLASTKPLGDAWVWDRAKSICDTAPLVSVTGAYGAFVSQETKPAPAEARIRMI